MTLDTSGMEDRPIQGGALVPVVIVGHVKTHLLNQATDQALLTDPISGALAVADTVHYEVHEGEMHHAEYLWASVLNNANADMLLVTGAKHVHTVFGINAGGSCYVNLYEQVTTTGNGTALPTFNMFRSSGGIALTAVYYDPTVTVLGFTLVNRYLPGGVAASRVGGGIRAGTEWILKPSTRYLFRATNKSGAPVAVSTAVEFYEEAV